LLLDNMAPAELRAAVAARDESAQSSDAASALEASGGISLDNVRKVAETGVDFIAIGALTHSAPVLDLSVLVEPG
jgi:nicotinate-nucleotide pyrophosphorylase (carboxylating)